MSRRRLAKPRRSPPARSSAALARAANSYHCELLEPRRMLVLLHGGGMAGNVPLESTFEYFDAALQDVRIALWGNVDAVAVFTSVLPGNTAIGFTDPVLAADAVVSPPSVGTDLFELYILDAQPGASISIAEVPNLQMGAPIPRPMEPVTTSPGEVRAFSNTDNINELINLDSDSGGVWIGARMVAPTDGSTDTVSDTPILSLKSNDILHGGNQDALDDLPTPKNGKVLAGIYSAPDVNLNRLFIGGVITGNVSITGSIEDFYAGDLLTGDAAGLQDDDGLLVPGATGSEFGQSLFHNFYVGGDLGQLDVAGTIGTDASIQQTTPSVAAQGPDDPNLVTGFQLYVGGHLGAVDCATSIVGSVTVINPSGDRNTGFTQTKSALPGDPINNSLFSNTYFEGDYGPADNAGVPSLYDPQVQQLFGNGYFGTAQYLGAPYYSSLGFKTATVDGYLQGDFPNADDEADWYAVPLMAGQTITVSLTLPDLAHNPTMAAIVSDFAQSAGYSAHELSEYLDTTMQNLRVGVFSPDVIESGSGSGGGTNNGGFDSNPIDLIASDYSSSQSNAPTGAFKFTAQQPGTYYFAVAYDGDINFNGVVDDTTITQVPESDFATSGFSPYQLEIQGVGNLAAGAVAADNSIDSPYLENTALPAIYSPSIYVANGDMGAIVTPSSQTISGTTITAGTMPPGGNIVVSDYQTALSPFQKNELVVEPYTVAAGNLREISAAGIGFSATETETVSNGSGGFTTAQVAFIRSAPNIHIPNGSVGLVQTTNPDDGLGLDLGFTNYNFNTEQPAPDVDPIGGSYQMVNAAGALIANLKASVSIGTVRAGSVGGDVTTSLDTGSVDPGSFQINAAGKPRGGVIDLINVSGNFGTLDSGGPAFLDGPGGDVHYLVIGGDTFRDRFFGGGTQEQAVTYNVGQDLNLIDDNGTKYTISPLHPSFTETSTNSLENADAGGQISIKTYPVRDSGGVVITNLTVLSSPNAATGVNDGGVTITSKAAGKNGAVEIGQIIVQGDGTDTVYDDTTGTWTTGANTAPLTASFKGNVPVDVYDLESENETGTVGGSGFTTVSNSTSGELVNLDASSINNLSGQTIGIGHSDVGGSLPGGYGIATTVFPFNGSQRTLIELDGDAKTISSRSGLADIFVQGTIGNLNADTAQKYSTNSTQVFAGIDGPVYASTASAGGATASNALGDILAVNIGQGVESGGSGDHPMAGLFADNYIGNVDNQGAGSDVHGPIVADGVFDGEPLYTTDSTTGIISIIPSSYTVIRSVKLDDAAVLGGIIQVSNLADALNISVGEKIFPNPVNPTTGQPLTAIDSITSTGRDAGFLGAVIGATNIGSITTSGGFGMVDSVVAQTPESNLTTLSIDGYGIRNSNFDGGNNFGTITVIGTGKLLDVRAFNPAAIQAEKGASFDSFSGQMLSAANDLDDALFVSKSKPKRVGYSESGTMSGDTFTGGLSLGTLSAWRLGSPATTTSANRFSFGLTIGTMTIANSVYDTSINTGGLTNLSIKDIMQKSTLDVSGPIQTLNLGTVKINSAINATGSDGTIGSVMITGQYLGTLTSTVSIDSVYAAANLNSPILNVEGNLNNLTVENSVLTAADIRVTGTLADLFVKKDFEGVLTAKVITTKHIGGAVTGTITTTG